MNDTEHWLRRLGDQGRTEADFEVDVRARVGRTIFEGAASSRADWSPLVFVCCAGTMAAVAAIAAIPAYQALFDPWLSYLLL